MKGSYWSFISTKHDYRRCCESHCKCLDHSYNKKDVGKRYCWDQYQEGLGGGLIFSFHELDSLLDRCARNVAHLEHLGLLHLYQLIVQFLDMIESSVNLGYNGVFGGKKA